MSGASWMLALRVIVSIVRWCLGKKAIRARVAKELMRDFLELQKEGDVLGEQIALEMRLASKLPWEDVPMEKPGSDGVRKW